MSSTEEKLLGNVFLANTDDPTFAAYLADRLGTSAVHYHPKVSFPPSWVAAKLKGPVTLAAYALRHCDHAPTLKLVATSDRRLGVQCALLENPHCTPAIKESLRSSPWCSTNPKLTTRLTRLVPWTFADHIDQILTDFPNTARNGLAVSLDPTRAAPIFEHIMYLLAREDSQENVDLVLSRFAAAGTLYVVRAYLYEYYHAASSIPQVFSRTTLRPEDVLLLMPKNQQREAALTIAAYATSSPPMATLISSGVAQLIDKVTNIKHQRKDSCQTPFHAFTDEALEYLIPKKKWSHILLYQRLTARQAAALLKVIENKNPSLLIEFYACRQFVKDLMVSTTTTRASHKKSGALTAAATSTKLGQKDLLQVEQNNSTIIEVTLEHNRKSGNLPLRFVTVAKLLECLSSPDDPRLKALVENVDTPELRNYVLGGWHINGRTTLPSVSDLPRLLARITSDPQYQPLATPITKFKATASTQYLEYLLNTIEGLAPQVLDDPAAASYVYSRLMAHAPSPAQAIDQFKNTSHSTLDKVCATIAALSRANSVSTTGLA